MRLLLTKLGLISSASIAQFPHFAHLSRSSVDVFASFFSMVICADHSMHRINKKANCFYFMQSIWRIFIARSKQKIPQIERFSFGLWLVIVARLTILFGATNNFSATARDLLLHLIIYQCLQMKINRKLNMTCIDKSLKYAMIFSDNANDSDVLSFVWSTLSYVQYKQSIAYCIKTCTFEVNWSEIHIYWRSHENAKMPKNTDTRTISQPMLKTIKKIDKPHTHTMCIYGYLSPLLRSATETVCISLENWITACVGRSISDK